MTGLGGMISFVLDGAAAAAAVVNRLAMFAIARISPIRLSSPSALPRARTTRQIEPSSPPRRCWAARRGAAPKRRCKGCPARVPGPALAGGCPLIEAPG